MASWDTRSAQHLHSQTTLTNAVENEQFSVVEAFNKSDHFDAI